MSRISKVGTKAMNDPKGKHGFIFKLKPEQIDELVAGLNGLGKSDTAAIYVNIYENESKFTDGAATYLNSTISVEKDAGFPTRGEQVNEGREAMAGKVDEAFKGRRG